MIFPIEMNTGIVLRKWCWIPNFPLDGIENSFNSGWTRRFPDFPICHVWLPEGSRGFFALDASEWQGPQTSLNGHDAWQIVPHRLNHASCPRLVEGHSILHYRICMYSIYIYTHTFTTMSWSFFVWYVNLQNLPLSRQLIIFFVGRSKVDCSSATGW